mmetsp:Transcript_12122/g.29379  ORF Transcript_12122/g.29379 Transcript_12122/m.29379 type:complete len:123 (+) Transcript_12122:1737-2105(+)
MPCHGLYTITIIYKYKYKYSSGSLDDQFTTVTAGAAATLNTRRCFHDTLVLTPSRADRMKRRLAINVCETSWVSSAACFKAISKARIIKLSTPVTIAIEARKSPSAIALDPARMLSNTALQR